VKRISFLRVDQQSSCRNNYSNIQILKWIRTEWHLVKKWFGADTPPAHRFRRTALLGGLTRSSPLHSARHQLQRSCGIEPRVSRVSARRPWVTSTRPGSKPSISQHHPPSSSVCDKLRHALAPRPVSAPLPGLSTCLNDYHSRLSLASCNSTTIAASQASCARTRLHAASPKSQRAAQRLQRTPKRIP
jgi:hypothetical protein